MRLFFVALTALVGFIGVSEAQPGFPRIQFGPFWFGMSVGQARQASPMTQWTEDRVSPRTNRPFAIRADDAITIAGERYAVTVVDSYHGAATLAISRWSETVGVEECQTSALQLLREVERQTGALHPEDFSQDADRTGPRARPTPFSWVRELDTPLRSTARVTLNDQTHGTLFNTDLTNPEIAEYALETGAVLSSNAGDITARFEATYRRDYYNRTLGSCGVQVQFQRDEASVEPIAASAAELVELEGPTIASRHYFVSRMEPALAADTNVAMHCYATRGDGRVLGCTPDSGADAYPSSVLSTANSLAMTHRFDFGEEDQDDPTLIIAPVRVHLSPSDVRPTDFLNRPVRASDEVVFERTPGPAELRRVFGRRSSPAGTVTLTCQVQSDQSALCGAIRSDDPALSATFERQAMALSFHYKVSPRLRSGASSEGSVFILRMTFEILARERAP